MKTPNRTTSGRYLRTRIPWARVASHVLMSIVCAGVPAAAQRKADLSRLVWWVPLSQNPADRFSIPASHGYAEPGGAQAGFR
jgi:hypothetical protein